MNSVSCVGARVFGGMTADGCLRYAGLAIDPGHCIDDEAASPDPTLARLRGAERGLLSNLQNLQKRSKRISKKPKRISKNRLRFKKSETLRARASARRSASETARHATGRRARDRLSRGAAHPHPALEHQHELGSQRGAAAPAARAPPARAPAACRGGRRDCILARLAPVDRLPLRSRPLRSRHGRGGRAITRRRAQEQRGRGPPARGQHARGQHAARTAQSPGQRSREGEGDRQAATGHAEDHEEETEERGRSRARRNRHRQHRRRTRVRRRRNAPGPGLHRQLVSGRGAGRARCVRQHATRHRGCCHRAACARRAGVSDREEEDSLGAACADSAARTRNGGGGAQGGRLLLQGPLRTAHPEPPRDAVLEPAGPRAHEQPARVGSVWQRAAPYVVQRQARAVRLCVSLLRAVGRSDPAARSGHRHPRHAAQPARLLHELDRQVAAHHKDVAQADGARPDQRKVHTAGVRGASANVARAVAGDAQRALRRHPGEGRRRAVEHPTRRRGQQHEPGHSEPHRAHQVRTARSVLVCLFLFVCSAARA